VDLRLGKDNVETSSQLMQEGALGFIMPVGLRNSAAVVTGGLMRTAGRGLSRFWFAIDAAL
jgi:hypothetical protein